MRSLSGAPSSHQEIPQAPGSAFEYLHDETSLTLGDGVNPTAIHSRPALVKNPMCYAQDGQRGQVEQPYKILPLETSIRGSAENGVAIYPRVVQELPARDQLTQTKREALWSDDPHSFSACDFPRSFNRLRDAAWEMYELLERLNSAVDDEADNPNTSGAVVTLLSVCAEFEALRSRINGES